MSLTNATMRGVIWEGHPYQMTVVDLPVPTIQAGTDAIVRMSTSAICGTDLHVYHGRYGSPDVPYGMGHEGVGYIAEIGDAVSSLSIGDWVYVLDSASSGHLEVGVPEVIAYGLGTQYGVSAGTQSEYLRVPFADDSLVPIPVPANSTNITHEYDYLLASDILATAWMGLDYAGFEAGDAVAIFGAGPVGLLATHSAIYRGASRVYTVDHIQDRLDLAESLGAIPINFAQTDPVEEILRYEPSGVQRAVDCVGAEAVNGNMEEEPGIVLRQMVGVAAPGGGLGQLGIMTASPNSTGTPLGYQLPADTLFPSSEFFNKALSLRTGPAPVGEIAGVMVDLISSGRFNASWVVSSEIGIEQVPEYYRRFDQRLETKVVIRFP